MGANFTGLLFTEGMGIFFIQCADAVGLRRCGTHAHVQHAFLFFLPALPQSTPHLDYRALSLLLQPPRLSPAAHSPQPRSQPDCCPPYSPLGTPAVVQCTARPSVPWGPGCNTERLSSSLGPQISVTSPVTVCNRNLLSNHLESPTVQWCASRSFHTLFLLPGTPPTSLPRPGIFHSPFKAQFSTPSSTRVPLSPSLSPLRSSGHAGDCPVCSLGTAIVLGGVR